MFEEDMSIVLFRRLKRFTSELEVEKVNTISFFVNCINFYVSREKAEEFELLFNNVKEKYPTPEELLKELEEPILLFIKNNLKLEELEELLRQINNYCFNGRWKFTSHSIARFVARFAFKNVEIMISRLHDAISYDKKHNGPHKGSHTITYQNIALLLNFDNKQIVTIYHIGTVKKFRIKCQEKSSISKLLDKIKKEI